MSGRRITGAGNDQSNEDTRNEISKLTELFHSGWLHSVMLIQPPWGRTYNQDIGLKGEDTFPLKHNFIRPPLFYTEKPRPLY